MAPLAQPVPYRGLFTDGPAGALMLSAPNRYRKIFRNVQPSQNVGGASPGMSLMAQEGCHGWDAAMAACVAMQRAEWPHLANRALGMEPHVDLADVVLTWGAP